MISASLPGMYRSWSVSSMRRMNCPCVWRAASHAKSAVRTDPKCSAPVGEGAKRVRIGLWEPVTRAASVGWREEDEREEGPGEQAGDQGRTVDVRHGDTHHTRRAATATRCRIAADEHEDASRDERGGCDPETERLADELTERHDRSIPALRGALPHRRERCVHDPKMSRRPHRLAVRTPPFQGGNRGSTPRAGRPE